MEQSNEQSNTAEKRFTDKENVDMIRKRAERAELMEPAMLLIMLIIGFIVILCNSFDVVTSLIYIAPCVVSSIARTLMTDCKNPTFKIHLIAMIASVLCLGAILVNEYIQEPIGYINYFLIVYPIYETLYIWMQKVDIDVRR